MAGLGESYLRPHVDFLSDTIGENSCENSRYVIKYKKIHFCPSNRNLIRKQPKLGLTWPTS